MDCSVIEFTEQTELDGQMVNRIRGRLKDHDIVGPDVIGMTFDQVLGFLAEQYEHFVKRMVMLKFHVDGIIALVIVEIVKSIVIQIIYDDEMFAFVQQRFVSQECFLSWTDWRVLKIIADFAFSCNKVMHVLLKAKDLERNMAVTNEQIKEKLNLLADSFTRVLYEEYETFLKIMEKNNLSS